VCQIVAKRLTFDQLTGKTATTIPEA
jgi:hypothetical protein